MRNPQIRFATRATRLVFTVVMIALSGSTSAQELDVEKLRMNQIQVIGSHNSYKAAIEPKFYREMLKVQPSLKELDYAHVPLTDQLNLGLRSLEIDVFHDPEGGRYAKHGLAQFGVASTSRSSRSLLAHDG